jgi:hypothetical protein
MAPTPTPVATAAASACRRVTPRRAGTAAESARSAAVSTLTASIQSAPSISYITQM